MSVLIQTRGEVGGGVAAHLQCPQCGNLSKSHAHQLAHLAEKHPTCLDDVVVGRLGNILIYQSDAELFHCAECFFTTRDFTKLYKHIISKHCADGKDGGEGGEEEEEEEEEEGGGGKGVLKRKRSSEEEEAENAVLKKINKSDEEETEGEKGAVRRSSEEEVESAVQKIKSDEETEGEKGAVRRSSEEEEAENAVLKKINKSDEETEGEKGAVRRSSKEEEAENAMLKKINKSEEETEGEKGAVIRSSEEEEVESAVQKIKSDVEETEGEKGAVRRSSEEEQKESVEKTESINIEEDKEENRVKGEEGEGPAEVKTEDDNAGLGDKTSPGLEGFGYRCLICGWRNKLKVVSVNHVIRKHDIPKAYASQALRRESFDGIATATTASPAAEEDDVAGLSGEMLKEEMEAMAKVVRFKSNRFVCLTCGWKTKLKGFAISHVMRCHEVESPYCCKECKRSFFLPSRLLQHVSTAHRPGRFACPFCYFRSHYLGGLRRHCSRCNAREEEGEEGGGGRGGGKWVEEEEEEEGEEKKERRGGRQRRKTVRMMEAEEEEEEEDQEHLFTC